MKAKKIIVCLLTLAAIFTILTGYSMRFDYRLHQLHILAACIFILLLIAHIFFSRRRLLVPGARLLMKIQWASGWLLLITVLISVLSGLNYLWPELHGAAGFFFALFLIIHVGVGRCI